VIKSSVRPWRGSFAALVAAIAASRLYVGYDSGGQHAAAACGTPLVTVFAGFASLRMFARWYPAGPGPKEVVAVQDAEPGEVLERTLAAVDRLTGR
jgi:ADP-heptose:LPS heptosyltransferase